ncbi:hypothetical protein HPB50_009737 [Hyalomma asiaticum]|uniref:Uncharacterized protein n=1 Tax=Hyalomma asiaticum TaxID=266040 RepID=A0ACB7TK46_HYAAI|nr:hypothetical protein HPB50_009737 [Hyalomma asiaticum]
MLDSYRTDKELEGEMYEIFGAELLGVIRNILDHRKELVEAMNADALNMIEPLPDVVPVFKNQPTKPMYGCQVTIQSLAPDPDPPHRFVHPFGTVAPPDVATRKQKLHSVAFEMARRITISKALQRENSVCR